MADEKHTLLDGKLHVYKRSNSSHWQCSTYLGGRNHRATTKEDNLAMATEFAREWYMQRYVEERQRRRNALTERLDGTVQRLPVGTDSPTDRRRRRTPAGPTFGEACDAFVAEYAIITQGERNERYVTQKSDHIRVHLVPFFGRDRPIAEITSGLIQEYRVHRQTSRVNPKTGEAMRPARNTLHSETVTLRQILKTANRKGWIQALPDMTVAYKTSGKIKHRAWFSPAEYKMLYEATRERAKNPKKERWRAACEQMHDYVLFMGNTGLRPDECARLEARDITVVKDEATGERILEIDVRGKRGVGHCKSMPGAVHPYQRVRQRKALKPTDLVFGKVQRELFNAVLDELNLKHDREGNVRTTYSLRHTYICMRLMEGADIYQIAKNCRTSVEMIETFYASHIKNTLDAASINVRKPKKNVVKRSAKPKSSAAESPTMD
jgi:integrase